VFRWLAAGLIAVAIAVSATVSSASAGSRFQSCPRFIVGKANSTAYPKMQLPARGRESGSSCATLHRIARRINNGTYRIPDWAWVASPAYGPPFLINDNGRAWACDVQNNGLSGPSYAVRCDRANAQLSWSTG
jgi:hypothetical protein